MSFHRPGFVGGGGGSSTGLPIIHESALQSIQGGAPGEHFHLTQAEYEALSLDLVCASDEIVFASGDIVKARNAS